MMLKLNSRCFLPIICGLLTACLWSCDPANEKIEEQNAIKYPGDLSFSYIPQSWDEGLPLGNGEIGALIWEKDGNLRFSLDHVGLWDLRPMDNLNGEEWTYQWVKQQWEEDEYHKVQELFDHPYDRSPAPSKIPGAALEFDLQDLGKVKNVRLELAEAVGEIEWESGMRLKTFVHAEKNTGFFQFQGIDEGVIPQLIVPNYVSENSSAAEDPVTGQDLRRLGYDKGEVVRTDSTLTYVQRGWGGFSYQVAVKWRYEEGLLTGVWSISTHDDKGDAKADAQEGMEKALKLDYDNNYASHVDWWKDFWSRSSISIPDQVLEKQWYLEQYKFGAAARADGPPISLQAVWTADNGKLPPWKGDYHHDLNTQLSYWPAYSADHLDLEYGFTNWLWVYKDTFKDYTKNYFGVEGLNVPGVTTLTGDPMGGWIQYSFGPTVSGWLAQHFYWHWKYSMDEEYLKTRAYPWFKEVAIFFDQIAEKGPDGKRKLPISSSPEFHDNSREAWFGETTNFDLSIIRFVYSKAAELALALGEKEDAAHWETLLNEWPEFALDPASGFMVAPEEAYESSHRHFSHLMAIHPLSLVNWSDGPEAQELMLNTINNLKKQGSSAWVGYSFSWLASLQARILHGDGAAETLSIFANNFCLPNSFHVNGDQSGQGYSNFTYRPFTLEGNFAFAAGLQEMLLQSHEGFIRLFPAIPQAWEEASFDGFLAQGAFKISAKKRSPTKYTASVLAREGGKLKIINPFEAEVSVDGELVAQGQYYEKMMEKGEKLNLEFIKQ
ncbi:glycosyl hydrolase family 95 catalytic domain-containing protein [Echinicola pacifica]|uniref:glycosyl hydrolase family 95 catalytic domain-containing protein n=1 Tax=Echinicola pacifica TaxID=346377 RepID=UPI0012FADAC7|nr:hypothetical protein [Echinicola pacifica]